VSPTPLAPHAAQTQPAAHAPPSFVLRPTGLVEEKIIPAEDANLLPF
jgi:hypothetical protein